MESYEGSKIVYEPNDGSSVHADIVFVHGLQGHKVQTWSSKGKPLNITPHSLCRGLRDLDQSNFLWPSLLLGPDIKNIRIILWGYDADVSPTNPFKSINLDSIHGHAESLISDLEIERDDETRPIIFIGHDLGGIVIKQALQRSQTYHSMSQNPTKGAIYSSTIGVIFLGTPHRGRTQNQSDQELIQIWCRLIQSVNPTSASTSSIPHLMEIVRPGSPFLDGQRGNFSSISKELYIVCGYETPRVGNIVPKDSAIIDGHNVVEVGIPANHANMCKFSSKNDIGYKRLLYQIRQCMRKISPPETSIN